MNYEIRFNTFNVLHVLLQNKVRNKAITCCVVNLIHNESINSRDSISSTCCFCVGQMTKKSHGCLTGMN